MNLVQQLAEYQNAPIQTLEAAKQGANPAISPWVAGAILSDRLEKQKRMQMAQSAAQGPQPTVSEQQDQQVAGIMGLQGAPQGAPQAQPAPQAPAPQQGPGMASGGIISSKMDPRMFDFSGGGIIAFSGKDRSDVPEADDTIYDPVTGVPISGGELSRGDDITFREAIGLGNIENRRALEKLDRDLREAKRAEQKKTQQDEMSPGDTRARPVNVTPMPMPARGAAPAKPAGGIATLGAVQKALTESDEWKDLDRARKAEYAAPNLPETAGALAAEKAAHLKAQGVEKAPWEIASEQTAAIQKMMESQEAERQAARKSDSGWLRMIANMGPGSFGQSGAQGLRALQKHEDEMAAEDQRVRERQLDLRMKLDAINAKAKELQYNEATGDVTKAQENRKELARLKRDADKDRIAIAGKQAELRERAAAAGLQADTSLAVARERAAAGVGTESKEIQMAEAAFARDPEAKAILKRLESFVGKKDREADLRRLREIQASKYRQFGLTLDGAGTMPAGGGPQLSAADQALINKYLPKK